MNTFHSNSATARIYLLSRSFARNLQVTFIALTVAVPVMLLVTEVTFAADVTVHVSKRGSSGPLGNVAVCLGTRGVPAQFGATLTDESGTAKFRDVPKTELILTASKPGMRGQRKSLLGSVWNRALVVSLPAGGGGPVCSGRAAATVPAVNRTNTAVDLTGLGIREFRINNGKRVTNDPVVTLDFVHSGDATHYRVSEQSDFGSAEWLPIDGDRRFDLSAPTGRKTIYLQVRKYIIVQGGEMQSVSDVARDSIVLEGG